MEVKLKNTIFANGFIPALNRLVDERLPVLQAYELKKFAKQVADKSAVYEGARKKLVEQYAKKDKDGGLVFTKDGKSVQLKDELGFNKEFVKLLDVEETYEIKSKVKLDDDVKISPSDLALLESVLDLN